MYYYTSLNNEDHRNRLKMQKTNIDTRLIEDVDQSEDTDNDIFYDISNDHGKENEVSSNVEHAAETKSNLVDSSAKERD